MLTLEFNKMDSKFLPLNAMLALKMSVSKQLSQNQTTKWRWQIEETETVLNKRNCRSK